MEVSCNSASLARTFPSPDARATWGAENLAKGAGMKGCDAAAMNMKEPQEKPRSSAIWQGLRHERISDPHSPQSISSSPMTHNLMLRRKTPELAWSKVG